MHGSLSPNSSEGCFIKDRWSDKCFSVSNAAKEVYQIGARVLDRKGRLEGIEDINNRYPLLTRGWVFQEYYLSPRLLQCNYGEFTFKCFETSCCECNSRFAPHPARPFKWLGGGDLTGGIGNLQQFTDLPFGWVNVIRTYMSLRLTKSFDVLPAIAGYAQVLVPSVKSEYVAGLWKDKLHTELLWHVDTPNKYLKPRPQDTTAPTWSWASVAMEQRITYSKIHKLKYNHYDYPLTKAIKDVYWEAESPSNPFGKLKYAYLKLHSKLYQWYLRLSCPGASSRGYTFRWDLHINRGGKLISCPMDVKPLPVNGVDFDLRLDGKMNIRKETEEHGFVNCHEAASECRCKYLQIYLLHARRVDGSDKTADLLLILKKVAPVGVGGEPNCYERFGMLKVENEDASLPSWDNMVDGVIKSHEEEFWLF
ncbi:uncharacterized protein F4822DRAFT_77958 [Hypoxylon trugodes]|uniref:uncharacterized protein n=1 Tax=Hypoxylon trugodes TaxID=326681 RepID=UPI002192CE15|nr:uncharacterized protein F4822DRAFT_77958 [Hypoxylon trugodes]KAI1383444.1 hypothetical protein F4822DRAFT_77958 [Hypoxylon trugodes]